AELGGSHRLLLLGGVVLAVFLEVPVGRGRRDFLGDVVLEQTVELLNLFRQSDVPFFGKEKLRHGFLPSTTATGYGDPNGRARAEPQSTIIVCSMRHAFRAFREAIEPVGTRFSPRGRSRINRKFTLSGFSQALKWGRVTGTGSRC